MEEEKKKNVVIEKLDNLDDKINSHGLFFKNIWQIAKFGIVSFLITALQVGLLYLFLFIWKNWDASLPDFLKVIFTPETVGEGNDNWGYVLPFFLSNLLANTVGYFLNKSRTFKSDAPIWHYFLYVLVLFILILFSTWFQGFLNNVLIKWGVNNDFAPFLAMNAAGFVQFIVLYPLQKFVLLREKKTSKIETSK